MLDAQLDPLDQPAVPTYTAQDLKTGVDRTGRALPCANCARRAWLGGDCLSCGTPYPTAKLMKWLKWRKAG